MTKTYRTIPADEVRAGFSPQRRRKIDMRAAELIAEEATLRVPRESSEAPKARSKAPHKRR